MENKVLMRKAIRLSIENVKRGGGPFGAVSQSGQNNFYRY
jgi:hypothetical protein